MSSWLFKISKTDCYFSMNIFVKIPEKNLIIILNAIGVAILGIGGASVLEIVKKFLNLT